MMLYLLIDNLLLKIDLKYLLVIVVVKCVCYM